MTSGRGYCLSGSFTFYASVLGAGLTTAAFIALVLLFVQRRNRSLSMVVETLEQALTMLERGMIDEEDYRRIKAQVMESYRPGTADIRSIRRWAVRGGILAVNARLIIMAVEAGRMTLGVTASVIPVGAGLVGLILGDGGCVVMLLISELRSTPRLSVPSRWLE